jgi:hypothetical protein
LIKELKAGNKDKMEQRINAAIFQSRRRSAAFFTSSQKTSPPSPTRRGTSGRMGSGPGIDADKLLFERKRLRI